MSAQGKAEELMKGRIAKLHEELGKVRSGRANPQLLDQVRVEYYGQLVPIKQVAAVSAPEARVLEIRPWDPTSLEAIEKAIQKSDLGVSPNSDSKMLRLVFPAMTEERRKDLAKVVSRIGEEYRVAVRNHRRDAMEEIKQQKLPEDQQKALEAGIQKLTDSYVKKVDEIVAEKQKEISTI